MSNKGQLKERDKKQTMAVTVLPLLLLPVKKEDY